MKIKMLKIYVLVEKTDDANTHHVSVVVEVPFGKDIVKEMDIECTDEDIESVQKIVWQFNDSEFGKQVQIYMNVK